MGFFRVVKSIFRGIAKAFAYIFVTLGLWLPALYSIVYLVAVGVSDRFAMKGATLAIFCVGLGITAVGGLALAMKMYTRRKAKRAEAPTAEEKPAKKKKSKREEAPDEHADAPYSQPGQPYYPYPYPPYPYPPQSQPYSQPQSQPYAAYSQPQQTTPQRDTSDLERKYFDNVYPSRNENEQPRTIPEEYGRTASRSDEQRPRSESDLGADELWRRLTGAEVPDEQPLVFRTRRDENLYVYEYSDRYQYWRSTKAGMVLESTEYKDKKTESGVRR